MHLNNIQEGINTQPKDHDISIITRGEDVIWKSIREMEYDIERKRGRRE